MMGRTDYQTTQPPTCPPPLGASPGERRTWDLDGSDRRVRREVFQRLPDILGRDISHAYRVIYQTDGRRTANLTLLQFRKRLAGTREQFLARAYRDKDLRNLARRTAEHHARRIHALRTAAKNSGRSCATTRSRITEASPGPTSIALRSLPSTAVVKVPSTTRPSTSPRMSTGTVLTVTSPPRKIRPNVSSLGRVRGESVSSSNSVVRR